MTGVMPVVVPEELPPRARRIPTAPAAPERPAGTTSACAENTLPLVLMGRQKRNYLRVRGEYTRLKTCLALGLELPPRARRIRLGGWCFRHPMGTTSACAENTSRLRPWNTWTWNYLRVRGEYIGPKPQTSYEWELPPRARRIPSIASAADAAEGTTSACAENTGTNGEFPHATGNYLRVRGEYNFGLRRRGKRCELPPRARRILRVVR